MEVLRRPGQYERLRKIGRKLMELHTEALTEMGIAHTICGDPTLFDVYFTEGDVSDYRSAKHRDPKINVVWNAALRAEGVFKSPGKLYPSLALTLEDLSRTSEAITRASGAVREMLSVAS